MSERRRCKGTNRDGGPCSAPPVYGGDYCLWHAEGMEDRRREWNRSGGKGKSNTARARKALPEDLREVGDWLLEAMGAVREGKMRPEQGNTLANLARSYVAIHEAGAGESRLSRLEEVIAEDVG